MKTLKDFGLYLKNPENKTDVIVLTALFVIAGVVLHSLFPFPFFMISDSNSYVMYASRDVFNIYRPMGYSRYLAFLHGLNGSIHFIFFATYFIHAASSLFLLFSVRYLLGLKREVFYILSALVLLSPTLLFATNFIMSDGIFTSLTMLFVASALWMICTRSTLFYILHLFFFILLFKIRYTGMFYLPLSILAAYFYKSEKKLPAKIFVCLIPVIVFFVLRANAVSEYGKNTGVRTMSAFSGWQLMNNASVAVPESKKSMGIYELKTPKQQLLYRFLKQCPDSLFTTAKAMTTTDLMWSDNSPYKQFAVRLRKVSKKNYRSSWVECGQLYAGYAQKLIAKYPFVFFRDYFLPSFFGFFKYQRIYEDRNTFVNEDMYRNYYHIDADTYKHSNDLFSRLNPLRKILNPVYWALVLLSFVLSLAAIALKKDGFRAETGRCLLMLDLFIALYILCSALASPNTTWRYAMPLYVPSLILVFYCIGPCIDFIKPHFQKY